MDPRRILLVTGYYPPHAPAGAVRPPKLVKHWVGAGRDVRVIAIDNRNLGATLTAEANATVAHLPYRAQRGEGDRPRRAGGGGASVEAPPTRGPVAAARRLYQQWATTPDRYAGWVAPALAQARTWARAGWTPDLVYSSGPPQRGHVAAARIAAALSRPWVAELRDLWVGNPYVDLPPPLRWWSNRLGRATLAEARGFVAVTEGAAAELRHQFAAPVAVAMNGFDPEDHADDAAPAPLDPDRLTILHAGVIYAGRRDPSALFAAIARLGPRARRIDARFHHDEFGSVQAMIARHGVAAAVTLLPLVPRRDILKAERRADVMLLCRWADPRDDAVIPGKLFEYIGARRPILAVGSETGEAATIVRAVGGLVSNDPATIAAALDRWLAAKDAAHGRLPDTPAAHEYDRARQFDRIDTFLAAL